MSTVKHCKVELDDILMVRRLTVNEFASAVGGSIPPRPIYYLDTAEELTGSIA
jgi:hypothetical protein